VEKVGYEYADGGHAWCVFVDGETGERYRISVPTECFYSESGSETGSVRVVLHDLKGVVPIHEPSGRYQAPPDFVSQIQMVREGFHLAFGRKAKEWPYLFQLRGYRLLLACPIKSKDVVSIESIEA
jgi:hypothetical protein